MATAPSAADLGRSSPAPRALATALPVSATAVVAAICFLVVRRGLIDDAYITLSYARNVAEHLHWGLTPHRTANSATSPLNILVLAGATSVVRDAVWGLGVVFVALSGVQTWGLLRLARALRLPAWAALAGALLVLLSPLMLSVVGMEMTLALTLLVWATVASAEERPILFGVLTALLVLTRVDLLVFPVLLWVGSRVLRRRTVSVAVTALITAAPWYLLSWFALGAVVPDTLVIKTVSWAAWGPWTFANGWRLYHDAYPVAVLLTAVPALLGVVAVAWSALLARRPRWRGLAPLVALGLGGIAHFAAYSVLAPPPYHWYYAPSAGSLTIVAALAAGLVGRRPEPTTDSPAVERPDGAGHHPTTDAHRRPLGRLPLPVVVAATLTGAALAVEAAAMIRLAPRWDFPPLTTNWASADQYLAIGEDLRGSVGDDVVRSPGEIGTIAYACRCDIVDSLSDPGTLQPQIAQRRAEAGPLMRRLLDLNFADRERAAPATPDLVLEWVPAGQGIWPVDSPWRGPGAITLHEP